MVCFFTTNQFAQVTSKIHSDSNEFSSFIGSAKPSNLRAKFENFAKVKEEEDSKRLAEQKRLREEKDRIDRDQALNAQQNGGEVKAAEQQLPPQNQQHRTSIDTGRSGGIGNAISMFNRTEDKPITPSQRVSRQNAIKLQMLID